MNEPIEPEEDREASDPAGPEVSAEPVQKSGIQIDLYGIKARIEPAPTGDKKPKSWSEVKQAVNLKLMSIAFDLVALPADILDGSRKLVRGLAKVPRKAARRVERGHEKADRAEGVAQEKAEKQVVPTVIAGGATDRIEALILKKQAEGFAAEIVDLGDGRQALVFVKPEERAIVGPLIRKALPKPRKAGGHSRKRMQLERIAELRALSLKGDDGKMELVEILNRHLGHPPGTLPPVGTLLITEIITHEFPDDPSLI